MVENVDARSIGQAHIGDDDIKLLLGNARQRRLLIARRIHAITFAQQAEFIEGAQIRLVINHQNARGRSLRGMIRHVYAPCCKVVTTNSLPSTARPRAVRTLRW